MNVGIIGSGNTGRSIGLLFAEHGHHVFFGARNPQQSAAAAALSAHQARVHHGTNQQAADFADLLVWSVRGAPASTIVPHLAAVQGKVVLDMNNNPTRTDGGIGPVDALSAGEKLQAELPGA